MSGRTSFLRLFTGFFLIATGVHASCPLEVSPPTVVVKYGDPVSVNCSYTGDEPGDIGWEANVAGVVKQPVRHLTWTVEKLTEWGVASQCYLDPFNINATPPCSPGPKVVLYKYPENIFIDSTAGTSGIMTELETYNITCAVYNVAPVQNLTIKLYKGDTILANSTSNNDTREPANHSLEFIFTPTRRDNKAKFHCEANLDLGPEGPQISAASEEYNITVHYGPDVHCPPCLWEGETLHGHCTVTGNPFPEVRWQKDGQLIDPAMNMSRNDTGTYTVEAVQSPFKRTFQICVNYGPELICPSSYTALEYTRHNLTCTVKGYPEPKTSWYKDGKEVELPEKLTRRDAGQYLVTASNNLSRVNLTVDINVIYPPSHIKELEDSEVDVGSILWLKCSSMGNPRPKYFWNYYETDNVKEKNEDGVSFLVIQNATAYNMGSYICYASNDRGNVSKTVRVTVKGAMEECPLQIIPNRMVIKYKSSSQNVTCQSTSSGSRNKEGNIYWQDRKGTKTNGAHLIVRTDEDWDSRPFCTATFRGIGECKKHLDVTLYKTPDSVSILHVNNSNTVVEDREFQLRCDITNVAPARNLTVLWYHGNEILEPHVRGSLKVTGCQSENNRACNISVVRTPLNVSSTVSIALNRKHNNGAGIRCEARLDLGPDGPQPPPVMMSNRLNLTIYYKPIINITKLQKIIPVFRGYPEELVCEADGHPPPKIQWLYSPHKVLNISGTTLVVSEAGFYNCSATNDIDSASYEVEVILKEDYLPLIAGFVALTVVIISAIFIFVYSIYYKNTKMRRYSLKNPKLSAHNGNVAHSGMGVQLPMTKLF